MRLPTKEVLGTWQVRHNGRFVFETKENTKGAITPSLDVDNYGNEFGYEKIGTPLDGERCAGMGGVLGAGLCRGYVGYTVGCAGVGWWLPKLNCVIRWIQGHFGEGFDS